MKISYSIVVYNNPISQVDALLKNIISTVPNGFEYQIFVINNNPDNISFKNGAKELDYKNVIFLNPPKNIGFGRGNNLAIFQTSSDYHIVMNPDVSIPDNQQIGNMISFMTKNNVVLLSPLIKYPTGEIQHLVKRAPSILDMGLRFLNTKRFQKRQDWFVYLPNGYSSVHTADNYPGSFLVTKTSTLKEVGGFDENFFMYMEDTDICRSLAKKGTTVFYPDAFIYHEWQRANVKNTKAIFQLIKSMFYFFNKWGWKFY